MFDAQSASSSERTPPGSMSRETFSSPALFVFLIWRTESLGVYFFNLMRQMERFRDSLDLAHLSIWRRALGECLPKGRQSCNFKRTNQICCRHEKESEAKTCQILRPSHNARRSLIFDIRANLISDNKAKLRFFFSLFFRSLKGRQQLLRPGFIMSKRKLIGYWIRFSEVQLKKVNPFLLLFYPAASQSLHIFWSKSMLHLWFTLWPHMWKRLYMMNLDELSHYNCDLCDLSGAAEATSGGKAYSPWSLLTSQLLSLRGGFQDQSLEECSS